MSTSGSRKLVRNAQEGQGSSSPSSVNDIQFDEPIVTTNNPMINDVILQRLFELCSLRQLNTLRQLSKQYYKLSLTSWLKAVPPLVFKDDEDANFRKLVSETDERSNSGSEIVGLERIPKFKTQFLKYDAAAHAYNSFWNLHGPWLTHLTVHHYQIPGVLLLLNILTCKFTPNLQFLDVECVTFNNSYENEDDVTRATQPGRRTPMDVVERENRDLKEFRVEIHGPKMLPMDWKTLLSHYPNLEHFCVGAGLSRGNPSSQLEPILRAIKEIRREDNDKLNLKSLTWFFNRKYRQLGAPPRSPPLSPSILEDFRQVNLHQLETFRIDFAEADSEQVINSLFATWAASLRKLEFFRSSLLQHLPSFQNMAQLQSLTLSGAPVSNLLFLADLPNLRSLNLWGAIFHENPVVDYTKHIFSATERPNLTLTFPSVTQFSCNYDWEWTFEDMNRLERLMPNLIKLELYLDNFTFRLVCQYWPRLEHLTVFGSRVGDKGIVGLVAEGAQQVAYKTPNITNLRELKIFAIDSLGLFREIKKTEFSGHSVFVGFAEMRGLQRLFIRTFWMDREVEQLIRRRMPFAKIKTGGNARWHF